MTKHVTFTTSFIFMKKVLKIKQIDFKRKQNEKLNCVFKLELN